MKKNDIKKQNYGFTLVETLVAISILSLSILAGFTAVQSSLQKSILSKEQAFAFFLAQDAIEFVKNIRDENALYNISGVPTDWLEGLAGPGDPCEFGFYCRIDSIPKTVVRCGVTFGLCPPISQDTNQAFSYGQTGYTSGWAPTKFRREVIFVRISDEEVSVTVRVRWDQGSEMVVLKANQLIFNHG